MPLVDDYKYEREYAFEPELLLKKKDSLYIHRAKYAKGKRQTEIQQKSSLDSLFTEYKNEAEAEVEAFHQVSLEFVI